MIIYIFLNIDFPSTENYIEAFFEATKWAMSELKRFMMGGLACTENVFLFVPNIIGYTRILLALFRYLSNFTLTYF